MARKRPDSVEDFERKKREREKAAAATPKPIAEAVEKTTKADTTARAGYIKRIKTALGQSVIGFVEAGRELIDAKEGPKKLAHGMFTDMIEQDLGMSVSMADRLMKIAGHPVLSKSAHGPTLPPAWRTLYELTKVPLPKLEAKMRDGTINPQMERKDVTALLPAKKTGKTKFKDTPDEDTSDGNNKIRMMTCPQCGGCGQIPVKGDF